MSIDLHDRTDDDEDVEFDPPYIRHVEAGERLTLAQARYDLDKTVRAALEVDEPVLGARLMDLGSYAIKGRRGFDRLALDGDGRLWVIWVEIDWVTADQVNRVLMSRERLPAISWRMLRRDHPYLNEEYEERFGHPLVPERVTPMKMLYVSRGADIDPEGAAALRAAGGFELISLEAWTNGIDRSFFVARPVIPSGRRLIAPWPERPPRWW